ncbi:MAG: acetyl-CoA decarbonylase/synthase complex subunit gamma [Candidatus Bathyarchaeota archaeon]|nr:acetyl-CoA decarbonylase/synthase complex subunit gamma [Candidatus Bathyarchaeota archaeon]MDH5790725.1 acetyl-CoA decarbonylase/synthase complex subunit gamma [Candidatus Bathyarchaeota archaeon]
MPAKELSPIEVYKLLPGTNCKECGETNCMAFAAKLVNREATLQECPPLLEPKYKAAFDKLWALLKPAVRSVVVGTGDRKATLGGEYVLYRHEFTYFNPTAIAIDVSDEMPDEEFEARIKATDGFKYDYIGMTLRLDMIAVRSTSSDPAKFEAAVKKAVELTDLPLILCALNPAVMKQALSAVGDRRPLIYAATKDNWKEMADLALMYGCPVVASAPFDLNTLKSIAKTLWEYGVEDIVLDPGTQIEDGLSATIDNFTILRWDAINEEEEHLGFPLLGAPIVAWAEKAEDPVLNEWNEAVVASALVSRFSDALILHSVSGWCLLPLVILRQNLYTDPRKPVSVEAGVKPFGEPNEMSPVLMTTNFALTYYTVASDIESAKVDCYLIVVDTEGISVESAVAGRKLTADNVGEALASYKVGDLVKHRHLVIPGRAARLSGEIQEVSGWTVSVGPLDSSGIASYIDEKWKPFPEE